MLRLKYDALKEAKEIWAEVSNQSMVSGRAVAKEAVLKQFPGRWPLADSVDVKCAYCALDFEIGRDVLVKKTGKYEGCEYCPGWPLNNPQYSAHVALGKSPCMGRGMPFYNYVKGETDEDQVRGAQEMAEYTHQVLEEFLHTHRIEEVCDELEDEYS